MGKRHGDIDQGQKSLYVTHLAMIVIVFATNGKNPSRATDFTGWTPQDEQHLAIIIAESWQSDFDDMEQGQNSY